jgi:hypothetical protein
VSSAWGRGRTLELRAVTPSRKRKQASSRASWHTSCSPKQGPGPAGIHGTGEETASRSPCMLSPRCECPSAGPRRACCGRPAGARRARQGPLAYLSLAVVDAGRGRAVVARPLRERATPLRRRSLSCVITLGATGSSRCGGKGTRSVRRVRSLRARRPRRCERRAWARLRHRGGGVSKEQAPPIPLSAGARSSASPSAPTAPSLAVIARSAAGRGSEDGAHCARDDRREASPATTPTPRRLRCLIGPRTSRAWPLSGRD